MASIARVRRALADHQPTLHPLENKNHAAVAVVLCDRGEGSELLFIERARHPDDPWSGHMAFPGGRVDAVDAHGRDAAERETFEEVGLSLADAELLGRLDDKQGNPATHSALVISAYVYHAPAPERLVTNHEVEEAFWFPVAALRDPVRQVQYTTAGELEFPGILVGEPDRHVVWGLTYSFLESFFEVLGAPLPNRWSEDPRRYSRRFERRP